MSATALDLRQPAAIAAELADLNETLVATRETPAAVAGAVADLVMAVADAEEEGIAQINPWLWIKLQRAALHAQAALSEEDPERRRALRLALEQLRFLFARIADREPVGESQSAAEVARWLEAALATVSQARKAELLGVSPRTYQRWISERDAARPSAADDRRLRNVARFVNQLRHSLTAPGVIDWFTHRRADLDGHTPLELLDDPSATEALIAAAAASRGHLAA